MWKKLLYRSASDVDDAGSDLAKMVSEIHKELEIETENAKELEVILLTGYLYNVQPWIFERSRVSVKPSITNTYNPCQDMSTYYFDGHGKAIRPVLTLMMANTVNSHLNVKDKEVLRLQRQVGRAVLS